MHFQAICAFSVALLTGSAAASGNPAIGEALAAHYKSGTPSSYQYALVDLNDDGISDAIVLIEDPGYCGSGGCNLAILRGVRGGFSYMSGSTTSRAPIRVLAETRNGWRSLSVTVAGSGSKPGEVLMRFNGRRYPLNPTLQPYATAADLLGGIELHFVR